MSEKDDDLQKAEAAKVAEEKKALSSEKKELKQLKEQLAAEKAQGDAERVEFAAVIADLKRQLADAQRQQEPADGVTCCGKRYRIVGEPRTVAAAADDMKKGLLEEDRIVIPIDAHHGI